MANKPKPISAVKTILQGILFGMFLKAVTFIGDFSFNINYILGGLIIILTLASLTLKSNTYTNLAVPDAFWTVHINKKISRQKWEWLSFLKAIIIGVEIMLIGIIKI